MIFLAAGMKAVRAEIEKRWADPLGPRILDVEAIRLVIMKHEPCGGRKQAR
jgi:hypothetical protein